VLLLNDKADSPLRLSRVLKKLGCFAVTVSCIEEAEAASHSIDVAVLPYHLASGRLGVDTVQKLRARRPEVPIIILSANLETHSWGPEDMQLLKGHSSGADLEEALRSLLSKQEVTSDTNRPQDLFYSRIDNAMGDEVVLLVLNNMGDLHYVNETCAELLEHPRDWFRGKNIFQEFPEMNSDWPTVIRTVADMRETYIHRSYRGMLKLPRKGEDWGCSVLAFPIKLYNTESGVVLTARMLERKR